MHTCSILYICFVFSTIPKMKNSGEECPDNEGFTVYPNIPTSVHLTEMNF